MPPPLAVEAPACRYLPPLSDGPPPQAAEASHWFGIGLVSSNADWPLFDAQGNTRKVTANNQSVSGTFVYDAFGNTTYSSGSASLMNRYCGNWGYRDDGDAGLLHVGARYYDPTTGRFTTRDALLTEHPYVYCDGDPVNKVDPSGHREAKPFPTGEAIGGLGGGFVGMYGGAFVISGGAGAVVGGGLLGSAAGVIILGWGGLIVGTAGAMYGGYCVGDWFTSTPAGDWLTGLLGDVIVIVEGRGGRPKGPGAPGTWIGPNIRLCP